MLLQSRIQHQGLIEDFLAQILGFRGGFHCPLSYSFITREIHGRNHESGRNHDVSIALNRVTHKGTIMPESDWPELAEEAQSRWNQNAAFWDDYMGDENNTFHNLLVRPAMESLLTVKPGDRVLDIGCGNGNYARRLAELGARVTAIDTSEEMIERARARSKGLVGNGIYGQH